MFYGGGQWRSVSSGSASSGTVSSGTASSGTKSSGIVVTLTYHATLYAINDLAGSPSSG